MKKVTVKVPATSANLGPGFDSLGCAWNLYNTFTFQITDGALQIEGCPKEFCNEGNLCIVGYRAVADKLNLPYDNLKLTIESEIPLSRGLGSSSTLIAGGAFACNALHSNPLSKAELLEICNKIEGHPDNLAPAIFGGLTASLQEDGVPYTVKYSISENIYFTALIPDFELNTMKARSVLPEKINFSDASYNLSHSVVLLKAFELGDFKLINMALNDKLHQPYRKFLIDEYDEVKQIATQNGGSLCISGAGPTLLCISDDKDFANKIKPQIENLKNNWTILPLTINNEGILAE